MLEGDKSGGKDCQAQGSWEGSERPYWAGGTGAKEERKEENVQGFGGECSGLRGPLGPASRGRERRGGQRHGVSREGCVGDGGPRGTRRGRFGLWTLRTFILSEVGAGRDGIRLRL